MTVISPIVPRPPRVVVGVSGATGAILAARCLDLLGQLGVERHLVVSPAGRRMSAVEAPDIHLADHAEIAHSYRDIGASIASGTFETEAMIVVPCSARSLSEIAWGGGDNLLARAADVTLKERRRLVLAVRESPYHLGHLRAMTAVTEMGAVVCPPAPPFYFAPSSVDDLVEMLAVRVLAAAGFSAPGRREWAG